MDLGRIMGEGEYDQSTLHEILKEVIQTSPKTTAVCGKSTTGTTSRKEPPPLNSGIPGRVWSNSLVS